MQRRRVLAVIAVIAVIAVVAALTAMPIAGGTAGAVASAKGKAPGAWAKSICVSVGSWLDTIEHSSAGKAAVTTGTSPKAAKKALLKLVATAISATNKLGGRLKQAGVPAVTGGKTLAAEVLDGYHQVQRTLEQAQRDLKKAPTKSSAGFLLAVRGAQDAVESAFEHVQAAFNAATNLDIAPLVKAFGSQPACTKITA